MPRSLLGALVALLLSAPAARADAIALADDVHATGVALAGAEALVVSESRGSVRLDAVALAGGARRTVLALPRRGWDTTMLAASAQRVALVVERASRHDEWRLYSGPPAGPLRLVHRMRDEQWFPDVIDVDGDRLLLVETQRFAPGLRARTLDSGGWTPIPWAGDRMVPVALAGDRVAAIAGDLVGEDYRADRVLVVDRATGAEQAAMPTAPDDVPAPTDVDVLPEGQLLAELGAFVATTAPGATVATVPRSGRLDDPRFVSGGIAAMLAARSVYTPVLVAPDGTRRRLGGPTSFLSGFAADDRGVAWLANGCLRYATVAGAGPPPLADDPCPSTEIGLYMNNDPKLRGRRIRVRVQCVVAPGGVCRGTLLIRHRGRTTGRGRFAIPAGRRPAIAVRLTRLGRRLVHGRNPVMTIDAQIPDGRIGSSRGVTELLVELP